MLWWQRAEEENTVLRASVSTLQSKVREGHMELDELVADYSAIRDSNQHLQGNLFNNILL